MEKIRMTIIVNWNDFDKNLPLVGEKTGTLKLCGYSEEDPYNYIFTLGEITEIENYEILK